MNIIVKELNCMPYEDVWLRMKTFTEQRDDETTDEIWLVEHPSVFTLGQSGNREHLRYESDIPVVKSDRGGQITYHGPGQLVVYLLLQLKRYGLNVRELVCLMENSVITLLSDHHILAKGDRKAPGVYVNAEKICSLGLRIKRGCSYHGLALNVAMDLTPFSQINPCGYKDMRVTMMQSLTKDGLSFESVKEKLTQYIVDRLKKAYNKQMQLNKQLLQA